MLADAFVTFQGERSLHFGKDNRTPTSSTFGQPRNLDADFFFRFIANDDTVETFRAAQDEQFHHLVAGFARGYNRYVSEIQAGDHGGRHADCRHEGWLRAIDEQDMYRRLVVLNLAGSSSVWLGEIAGAQPPSVVLDARRQQNSGFETASLALDPGRFYLGRHSDWGAILTLSAATPPAPTAVSNLPTRTGIWKASTAFIRYT